MSLPHAEHQIWDEIEQVSERLAEDRLYECVLEELEADFIDPIAKARSLVEAGGDREQSRALYIKHRVRRLSDLSVERELSLKNTEKRQLRSEKTARTQKAMEEKRARRKQALTDRLNRGKLPTSDIQLTYRGRFIAFCERWEGQDPARRYLPRLSAWAAFLREEGLID